MAKLEAELDAAGLLVTAERREPRAFTFADISKLRYLDCIIKVRVGHSRLVRTFFPLLVMASSLSSIIHPTQALTALSLL